MPKPRAYLIDSIIYIFRAWYIYDASITDTQGQPVNAALGFSDFLWQLIRQKQPRYIACAFDESQTHSYRRELFPEYKANRDPAPAELKHQFQLCRSFCDAIGLPAFGSNRFEADDIIGSLATRLREQGYALTIVSADKDLTQLIIGEEDAWWDFARGTVLNHRGIARQFGVRPEQIADMLALSGDKVDNIPGIPGIGYKMAANILKKYHCIESILENIDQIADMKFRGAARVHALLHAHKHILPLNKQLTTIVTDMEMESGDLSWKHFNDEAFASVSRQLSLSELIQ
ncbi:MAG: 5'-3' exonuclease, partial [Pseudohongiellaceae bacterium]